jgi:hypothetical protein
MLLVATWAGTLQETETTIIMKQTVDNTRKMAVNLIE